MKIEIYIPQTTSVYDDPGYRVVTHTDIPAGDVKIVGSGIHFRKKDGTMATYLNFPIVITPTIEESEIATTLLFDIS